VGDSVNFGEIYSVFTEESSDLEVKLMIGRGLHEVVREAEAKARNPFMFKRAISYLLKDD
jgi:hypothetical protein